MDISTNLESKELASKLKKSFVYATFLVSLIVLCGGLSDNAARFIGIALGGAIILTTNQNILFVIITYTVLIFYSTVLQLSLINTYYSDSVLDNITTQLANGVMMVGVGAGLLFGISRINLNLPLLGRGVVIILMLLFCMYVTDAQERGLIEVNRMLQFLIYFTMLGSFITNREKLLDVIIYALGSFFVLMTMVFIQFLTEPAKFNGLGKFLVFIPILQALAEYCKSKNMKSLYKWLLAFAVIGSLMLLLGESRRLIFSLVLVWTFYLFQIGFNKRILFTLALSFFIIYNILPENFFARTTETVDYYSSTLSDESGGLDQAPTAKSVTSSRNILWGIGWQTFLSSPFFGVGPGMSDLVVGSNLIGSEYEMMRIHNLYLEILADTGILGFIVILSYFIAIWMMIRRGIKISRRIDDVFMKQLFLAYRVVFISTLVVNFYGNAGVFGKYEWFFNAIVVSSYLLLRSRALKHNAALTAQ